MSEFSDGPGSKAQGKLCFLLRECECRKGGQEASVQRLACFSHALLTPLLLFVLTMLFLLFLCLALCLH